MDAKQEERRARRWLLAGLLVVALFPLVMTLLDRDLLMEARERRARDKVEARVYQAAQVALWQSEGDRLRGMEMPLRGEASIVRMGERWLVSWEPRRGEQRWQATVDLELLDGERHRAHAVLLREESRIGR